MGSIMGRKHLPLVGILMGIYLLMGALRGHECPGLSSTLCRGPSREKRACPFPSSSPCPGRMHCRAYTRIAHTAQAAEARAWAGASFSPDAAMLFLLPFPPPTRGLKPMHQILVPSHTPTHPLPRPLRRRPPGGVLAGFTKCSREEYRPNSHVKSFVNTAHVARAGWSPHHFEYQDGFFAGARAADWAGRGGFPLQASVIGRYVAGGVPCSQGEAKGGWSGRVAGQLR